MCCFIVLFGVPCIGLQDEAAWISAHALHIIFASSCSPTFDHLNTRLSEFHIVGYRCYVDVPTMHRHHKPCAQSQTSKGNFSSCREVSASENDPRFESQQPAARCQEMYGGNFRFLVEESVGGPRYLELDRVRSRNRQRRSSCCAL